MKRKIMAMLLAFLMIMTMVPIIGAASSGGIEIARYCVLVLDTSGSMSGTPIKVQKQAAQQFCEDAMDAEGTNYVAIVRFDSSAAKVCDFTDDLDELTNAINRLSAGGGTNICSALNAADTLLQSVTPPAGAHVIRNIVLCTDGVPESGLTSDDGPFDAADGGSYRYDNATYNTAVPLQTMYKIYTLGFFHGLSGRERTTAQKLLDLIQNAGYHEVTDPDILGFVFGDIIDSITNARRHDAYSEEIARYNNTRFADDAKPVVIPVQGSSDYRNTSNPDAIQGNLVSDAAQILGNAAYDVVQGTESALNLQPGSLGGAASSFDLLLADVLTGPTFYATLKASGSAQYMNCVSILLNSIVNYCADNIAQLAADTNTDLDSAKGDWAVFAQNFDTLNITNDSGEFQTYFGMSLPFLDKYVNEEAQKAVVSGLRGAGSYSDATLDTVLAKIENGEFRSAFEMIQYSAACEAYRTVLEELSQALQTLQSSIASVSGSDQPQSISLAAAVNRLVQQIVVDPQQLESTVAALVGADPDSFGELLSSAATSFLAAVSPTIANVGSIRQSTVPGQFFVAEVSNLIGDKICCASLVSDLYLLGNSAIQAASTFGTDMVAVGANNGKFRLAYKFELVFDLWKYAASTLCGVAQQLEAAQLQDYLPELQGPDPSQAVLEEGSWCSAAGILARTEAKRLDFVDCHDVTIDAPTPFSRNSQMQIICIACPVDVIVQDSSGQQMAVLSDSSQDIAADDYEPYFQVLPTSAGSDADYMKVCMIPNTWTASFKGTDSGTMHVLKSDIKSGRLTSTKLESTNVYRDTQGRVSNKSGSGDMLIIDDQGAYGFKITYDPGAGTVDRTTDVTDFSGKLASLPVPARNSFEFDGWYLPNGTRATTDTAFTADTVLTAKWSEGLTIPPMAVRPLPAPGLPYIEGYQAGMMNGRTYYAKVSGATAAYYLQNSAGKLVRVSVPYTADSSGRRFYPINCGGQVLFPRIESGKPVAYCFFANDLSLPRLQILMGAPVESANDYQTIALNNRDYFARTSGAGMLFYMLNSSGKLVRVSAPFVTDSSGQRFYPVNFGGKVLLPVLTNGKFSSYSAVINDRLLSVLAPA